MAVSIKMTGDKELQAMLSALPEDIQRKLVKSSIRKGAERLRTAASRLAPRSREKKHGKHMADTFKVRVFNRRGKVGAKVAVGTRTELGIDPKDPYFYPAIVEYGSKNLPAHHPMRSAMEMNRAAVISDVAADLRQTVKAVSRG
jgi:HK97 gp10 family phage protein